ncbi:MAG TPA: EAL domain-containing protein [Geminicoccaceae bacterium]|nr:EAL domain-containing protein [Geminicoccus sp.]HMU51681.1 EAL domain-containing protein [Geminicoccaceae bacterium]
MASSPPAPAALEWRARPPERPAEARLAAHARQAAANGERLAVATVEIENIDALASTFGAAAAERLLTRLERSIGETMGHSGELVRAGRAELLVLCPLLGGLCEARALAHRLAMLTDGPLPLAGRVALIRSRVGLAIMPDDAAEPGPLLQHARIAARHARRDARRRPQFYMPEMDQRLTREQSLAQELRQALDADGLELVFQPQLDISGQRIFAAEALLRWRHPRLGLVAPDEFVPLAERWGLIDRLGRWVLEHACLAAATWRRRQPRLRLAVNLSPAQLCYPEIVDEVEAALAKARLDPAALMLEITESVATRDLEGAQRALGRLRRAGVAISLDDFGAGHSGIGYLRELPLDQLKIDRSLVGELGDGQGERSLAGAVAAMGRLFGLQVLAEGVETSAQLAEVRRLGCDAAQGYLIARPMPAAALVEAVGAANRAQN